MVECKGHLTKYRKLNHQHYELQCKYLAAVPLRLGNAGIDAVITNSVKTVTGHSYQMSSLY